MKAVSTRRLFLSAVSSEFRSYREELAKYFRRASVEVKTQEDFGTLGGTTLEKLDLYIQQCNAVVHLVGDAVGALPQEDDVRTLLTRHPDLQEKVKPLRRLAFDDLQLISYTQWEAYLAIYHGRPLHIYKLMSDAPSEPVSQLDAAEVASQQQHFDRIRELGRDRDTFSNQEQLVKSVLADLHVLLQDPPTRRWKMLAFAGLGLLCVSGFISWIFQAPAVRAPTPKEKERPESTKGSKIDVDEDSLPPSNTPDLVPKPPLGCSQPPPGGDVTAKRTLELENGTKRWLRIWRYAEPRDGTGWSSWKVKPSGDTNDHWRGGCNYLIIEVLDQSGKQIDVGWIDFGWDNSWKMSIPERLLVGADPKEIIKFNKEARVRFLP